MTDDPDQSCKPLSSSLHATGVERPASRTLTEQLENHQLNQAVDKCRVVIEGLWAPNPSVVTYNVIAASNCLLPWLHHTSDCHALALINSPSRV